MACAQVPKGDKDIPRRGATQAAGVKRHFRHHRAKIRPQLPEVSKQERGKKQSR